VHRWRGLGFRFLLTELFVLWLIAAVHVHVVVADYVDGYLQPMFEAMPKLGLKNGTLTINRPDKYQIKDPRNGKVVVNFDMTEKPVLPAAPESGILSKNTELSFEIRVRNKPTTTKK